VLADLYVEERSWTKLPEYRAQMAKALGIKESDVDRLIAEFRTEEILWNPQAPGQG
jgi:hypothetical protein